MILKVRHAELNDVKNKIINDSNILDNEINNLLQYINELKSVWQGVDADTFCNESYNYINRMKGVSNCFKVLGNFIKDANCAYEENDNSLKKELEKEAK
jgi:uncharacterized protein YukE